eukprot:gene8454-8638_t
MLQVNVNIGEAGPGAGLGLFASRNITKGDVLLSFPTDLAFAGVAARNGVMDFLLDYVLDLHDQSSPRKLMWATTPCPQELRHLLNFPQPYLPLLQHKQLEEWMGTGLHQDLQLFSRIHAARLQEADISYEDLVHAMGLIGTRTFNKPSVDRSYSTYYALPLLDMANHNPACPHNSSFKPCAFDASRECVYLMAGADLAPGQELGLATLRWPRSQQNAIRSSLLDHTQWSLAASRQ